MNVYDQLLDVMRYYRKDATASEFTNEFIENLTSLQELHLLTQNDLESIEFYINDDDIEAVSINEPNTMNLNIYLDMVESYHLINERITREERRNFVFGMNYFHTSETLDQQNNEMPVNNEKDIDMLIENRLLDLEYMIEDKYPGIIDAYTKAGMITEAKIYYKK